LKPIEMMVTTYGTRSHHASHAGARRGDHDIVRDEHTLEIYHHIPNSQLAIFPNATHMVPYDDAKRFNSTVEQFFRTPFVKRDPIKDAFASGEKMRAAEGRKP
jgi:hypothetical protein